MQYPAELLRKQIIRYFLFISEPACPGIPTREFLKGNSHIILQGCQSQVQASCESQIMMEVDIHVCFFFWGGLLFCLFACLLFGCTKSPSQCMDSSLLCMGFSNCGTGCCPTAYGS